MATITTMTTNAFSPTTKLHNHNHGTDVLPLSSSSSSSSSSSTTMIIPRIKASEFDPNIHYYRRGQGHRNDYYETPVIVEGVLSSNECEKFTNEIINQCGDVEVILQRKKRTNSILSENEDENETDMYYCSFLEAIELIVSGQSSNHNDTLLAFCEGLLLPTSTSTSISSTTCTTKSSSSQSSSLQKRFEDIREGLFQHQQQDDTDTDKTNTNTDPCWFQTYFPKEARPSDCVIVGGIGSSSTLHRDPLEWTGTNLCLDGQKVWRFIVPSSLELNSNNLQDQVVVVDNDDDDDGCSGVTKIDKLLDSYRLDSIAWGNGNEGEEDSVEEEEKEIKPLLTLSAGWQSDFSLFYINSNNNNSNHLSSNSNSNNHDNDDIDIDDEKKFEMATAIATDLRILQPNIPVNIATTDATTDVNTYTHTYDDNENDHENDQTINKNTNGDKTNDDVVVTIWSGVQRPGDMIIIPAYWWHQTYNAFEPTLAIASQRCGKDRDAKRVISHIIQNVQDQHHQHQQYDDHQQDHHHQQQQQKATQIVVEIAEDIHSSSSSSSPEMIVDRLFTYLSSIQQNI